MSHPMQVTKASGEIEVFSEDKLVRFLSKIQLPPEQIGQVMEECKTTFHDHISTREITDRVATTLSNMPNGKLYAARYLLKRDLRKLGPAGHAFEKYIGRLFEARGAITRVGIEVQGQCVPHEVDVLARWDHHLDIVECKFHNSEGTKSDVVVALYIYARYLDLSEALVEPGYTSNVWLATNTKLTSQAIEYANCKNMQILTVELPEGNSILNRVVEKNLFPITSIHSLEPSLTKLFDEGMVMLSDVLAITPDKARKMGISDTMLKQAQGDALEILG